MEEVKPVETVIEPVLSPVEEMTRSVLALNEDASPLKGGNDVTE